MREVSIDLTDQSSGIYLIVVKRQFDEEIVKIVKE
jgi:hypothetical protein